MWVLGTELTGARGALGFWVISPDSWRSFSWRFSTEFVFDSPGNAGLPSIIEDSNYKSQKAAGRKALLPSSLPATMGSLLWAPSLRLWLALNSSSCCALFSLQTHTVLKYSPKVSFTCYDDATGFQSVFWVCSRLPKGSLGKPVTLTSNL